MKKLLSFEFETRLMRTDNRCTFRQKIILSVTLIWLVIPTVNAAQLCYENITSTAPGNRFEGSGDEVQDLTTGLYWKKCAEGLSGENCTEGTAQAMTIESALQLAKTTREATGQAWRLPNIKELRSLVEESCTNPAINETVFPNTPWSGYHLSSTMSFRKSLSGTISMELYSLRFQDGYFIPTSSYGGNVRLVRDP